MASLAAHTVCKARPRPLASRWTARTPGRVSASDWAIGQVPSLLALSAMVMRKVNGSVRER